MPLSDIWLNSRDQLQDKHVQQIISFAGEGQLKDGSTASTEFRDFLSLVPPEFLLRYADQCLNESFPTSGLALQDIVNQIGRRLGFEVTDGRYRGSTSAIGFDGIWRLPDGHCIVVEVKTTDAYRVDLGTIADYRRELANEDTIPQDKSSILIVVGRHDTGDLEAQVRGSRHAWDVRLISVDALARLMSVKQALEDPAIIARMHAILVPREFTKLDEIVEIVFTAAEEIKQEEIEPEEEEQERESQPPAAFHNACVARIEKSMGQPLVKRTRATYLSADGKTAFTCAISRTYRKGGQDTYWFAFHPHQRQFLESAPSAYVAFGCGSENTVLLIPATEFFQWLPEMLTTESENRFYWHVNITKDEQGTVLHRKRGAEWINLGQFLLRD